MLKQPGLVLQQLGFVFKQPVFFTGFFSNRMDLSKQSEFVLPQAAFVLKQPKVVHTNPGFVLKQSEFVLITN